MAYKQIQVMDLPAELVEQIGNEISEYSTALISLRADGNNAPAKLIGSGTLIQFGNVYGILTAHHVASSSAFRQADRLGLDIMTGEIHNFSLPRAGLNIVNVGIPPAKQILPDLSVIILPQSTVPRIRARKAFWNLGAFQQEALNEPRDISEGAWVLCGFPGELAQPLQSDLQFDQITLFEGLCGFAGISKEWIQDSYDYLEYAVSYDALNESPKSFRGVSGGGLWQVPLLFKGDMIIHDRPVLSGVAFHQSDVVDHQRKITCHGRVSIYRHVVAALESL